MAPTTPPAIPDSPAVPSRRLKRLPADPALKRRFRRRRAALRIAALIVLALLLAYAGLSLIAAQFLTSPRIRRHEVSPLSLGPRPQRWQATTEDGLTLRGWFVQSDSEAPTPDRSLVVLIHGLWMNWDEVSGPARGLCQRGHDVLLFDLRGHGLSDPDRMTMGRHERRDLRAALAWARAQGYSPEQITWVGFSLGGSTILLEAAENPDIQRAVIDSPFGNLPDVLSSQLSLQSGLPSLFNPGILTAARWVFGIRTDDLLPEQSARAWGDRPLLLIHGTADSIVPVEQGKAIALAAGPRCEAHFPAGIEHVKWYATNRLGYVMRLDRFIREHRPHAVPADPS